MKFSSVQHRHHGGQSICQKMQSDTSPPCINSIETNVSSCEIFKNQSQTPSTCNETNNSSNLVTSWMDMRGDVSSSDDSSAEDHTPIPYYPPRTRLTPVNTKPPLINNSPSNSPINGYPKPDLTKTKLCPFLRSGGLCSSADRCKFAHSFSELRATPNFYKTVLCNAYTQYGKCRLGRHCRYAHGEAELRPRQDYTPTNKNSPIVNSGYHVPTEAIRFDTKNVPNYIDNYDLRNSTSSVGVPTPMNNCYTLPSVWHALDAFDHQQKYQPYMMNGWALLESENRASLDLLYFMNNFYGMPNTPTGHTNPQNMTTTYDD